MAVQLEWYDQEDGDDNWVDIRHSDDCLNSTVYTCPTDIRTSVKAFLDASELEDQVDCELFDAAVDRLTLHNEHLMSLIRDNDLILQAELKRLQRVIDSRRGLNERILQLLGKRHDRGGILSLRAWLRRLGQRRVPRPQPATSEPSTDNLGSEPAAAAATAPPPPRPYKTLSPLIHVQRCRPPSSALDSPPPSADVRSPEFFRQFYR